MIIKEVKYKFRGKRISDGAWAYGDLLTEYVHHSSGASIVVGGCVYHEVDPKTVGQFTGKYDRLFTEIYDGDIICSRYGGHFVVYFARMAFCLRRVNSNRRSRFAIAEMGEVVGNIHDNPELLEVE